MGSENKFHNILTICLPNKKYNIVLVNDRLKTDVIVFFNYEKINKFHIKFNHYWILNGCNWEEKQEERTIFLGNTLKMI